MSQTTLPPAIDLSVDLDTPPPHVLDEFSGCDQKNCPLFEKRALLRRYNLLRCYPLIVQRIQEHLDQYPQVTPSMCLPSRLTSPTFNFPKLTHGPDLHTHEGELYSLHRVYHAMAAWQRDNLQRVDDILERNSQLQARLERSHLCGFGICDNYLHITYESRSKNKGRKACHNGRHVCSHETRCITNRGYAFVPVTPGDKGEDPMAAGHWADSEAPDPLEVLSSALTCYLLSLKFNRYSIRSVFFIAKSKATLSYQTSLERSVLNTFSKAS